MWSPVDHYEQLKKRTQEKSGKGRKGTQPPKKTLNLQRK